MFRMQGQRNREDGAHRLGFASQVRLKVELSACSERQRCFGRGVFVRVCGCDQQVLQRSFFTQYDKLGGQRDGLAELRDRHRYVEITGYLLV
jgi:hypothetical protein